VRVLRLVLAACLGASAGCPPSAVTTQDVPLGTGAEAVGFFRVHDVPMSESGTGEERGPVVQQRLAAFMRNHSDEEFLIAVGVPGREGGLLSVVIVSRRSATDPSANILPPVKEPK